MPIGIYNHIKTGIRIRKQCQICKKEFLVIPSRENIAKYCSRKCRFVGMRKQLQGENNPFYGKKHSEETRKKLSKNGKGKHYSPKTEFKKGRIALKGKQHPSYKDGKFLDISQNRWFILKSDHPFANKRHYILQSRLIAEKYLGRYLTHSEVVHHIDENSSNDNPKNLYVFSTSAKHTIFHKLKNKPKLISNIT